MQNRFKFRIWDKIDKRFMSGSIFIDCRKGAMTGNMPEDKYVIQQSTGLKDKTGKLIYEGDILKFYAQSIIDAMAREPLKERIGVAVWNEEELKFDVSVDNGKNVVPNLCKKTDDNNFEIIGNIYENPDLLEEKK